MKKYLLLFTVLSGLGATSMFAAEMPAVISPPSSTAPAGNAGSGAGNTGKHGHKHHHKHHHRTSSQAPTPAPKP